MFLYQLLLDAGFSELELETKASEGHSIQQIYDEAVDDGLFD